MNFWNASRYMKVGNGNKMMSIRLSKHRAVGKYFQIGSGDCDRHLSIFVGDEANHVQTPVPYTEIRYKPEAFMENPEAVVYSIVDSMQKFINGESPDVPDALGVKTEYEKEI